MTKQFNPNSFYRFCETVQEIAETRGSNRKIRMYATYLSSLKGETDLDLAARFTGEGAFSAVSGRKASIGSRTIAHSACRFCEVDYEKVFRPCRIATGSASEAIEKLTANLQAAREKRTPEYPDLQQMMEFYTRLEAARNREQKEKLLIRMWEQLTPLEIKYSLRVLGQGSLRIGFEAKSIVTAIAESFGREKEAVRYAHMISGSLGRAAVLSYRNELESAQFTMFRPISFMLASAIESRAVKDVSRYLAEEKLDGMRCQIHIAGSEVKLYSRDLNEITGSFPEVVDFFRTQYPEPVVMDGELCVFREGMVQTFNDLQQRMGVKQPGRELLETHPVKFVAFDLLFTEGTPVFDRPLEERRDLLYRWCRHYDVPMTRQLEVSHADDVSKLFYESVARGNEGLILKRKGSVYENGERRKSWLKVKEPGGSVDTVIMYAHAGSGKRGGTYSDFTLGVRVAEDERYEEEFIPIGKAYGGYSDEELKMLNREIRKLAVDRFGPTLSLKPGIVVEIEFDDIQPNSRTKAKYTLRFPRFRTIRWDLSPGDCDTLRDVEQLYEAEVNHKKKATDRNKALIMK